MPDYFTDFANHKPSLIHPKEYSNAVFDFQADCLHEMVKSVKRDAHFAFYDGNLKLPYDQVFYVFEEKLKQEGAVMYVTKVNDGEWLVRLFYKRKLSPAWEQWPVFTSVKADKSSYSYFHPSLKEGGLFEEWSNNKGFMKHELAFMANYALALSYILAQPRSHSMTSIATQKSTNQLRRFRKKPALPPVVRVIRMDVTWLTQPVPKGNSHASPCPHERKAHKRRLRNGIVVNIAASSVLGGGPKPRVVVKDGTM